MNWASNIINDINSILLPPGCFGCNARLSGGEYLLCTVCRHDLPLTDYTFTEENPIDRLFYGRVPIEKAAAFLLFSDIGRVKNLLHHLKYRNQETIGAFLGDWFGGQIATGNSPEIDLVVPVPLHPKKQRKRGYNQVTLFAKQLAQHLGAFFRADLLVKTRNTKTQTQRNRWARWKNSQELFIVENTGELEGKKVLLVDDVITTGATIEACAKALLKSSGTVIYVATMAVVPLNRS
ncbi:MAG: ComF family protein [Croceivirga sp.]